MDIPALSMAMAQAEVQSEFGIAMLAKTLDVVTESGENMTALLEQAVNPHIGGNIDISI